ncbi:hypothetical protein ACTFIY_002851 [Dictyostelium cf. discoideum]
MLKFCIKCGYKFSLDQGIIPNSIHSLKIGEIKELLSKQSIPYSVHWLHFLNDFNHPITPNMIPTKNETLLKSITKEIIPHSVEKLRIFEIKSTISSDKLPPDSNTKHLHIDGGPDQQLIPGLITENVRSLFLYSLKYPLLIGSIPPSVNYLRLCNGFNQPLISEIIPNSVETLGMYDIKYPPKQASMPNSVTDLFLCGRFSHSIDENVLPTSILHLHLYNIVKPIPSNSILNIKWLFCYDDFSHKLDISFLPSSIEKLILYNQLVLVHFLIEKKSLQINYLHL